MEKHSEQLNNIFQSLADPTRRAVLARLGKGPASISELARPTGMALPSFLKHVRSLERSGLIRTRKEGRVRTCVIEKPAFAVVDTWLAAQRTIWEGRTDRLEEFVITAQERELSK
ncbi:MAG: metalloregulator ArsR/SmtB family transcription factor [Trueperaceae bacterium]